MTIAHHTVALSEVRMHYVRTGDGPPVVLLHGWPEHSACWEEIMGSLGQHFTVIAPDLRGLGYTSKPLTGYDTDRVAQDVKELTDHLGFERFFLTGHDWGAATAYALAAQHRDAVLRLAIFEMVFPGFGIMEQAMVPAPHGQFLWHMSFQGIPDIPLMLLTGREEEYLSYFYEHYSYDPAAVSPERMRQYAVAMQSVGTLRASLGYYRDYFRSAEQNAEHRRTKLAMPVMAWGGEACLGPLSLQCAELAADDVRGGIIERCGHWVCEERPDFVGEQLLAFFTEQ